jgi:hypothetical protein
VLSDSHREGLTPTLFVTGNRARDLVADGVDQLWRADIWKMILTLAALPMALLRHSIQQDLVHHSYRGRQYAGTEYTDLVKSYVIDISMSRKDLAQDPMLYGREDYNKTLPVNKGKSIWT